MEQEVTELEKAALLKHYGLRRGLENIITRLRINPQTETYYRCKELDDRQLLEVLDTYIRDLRKRVGTDVLTALYGVSVVDTLKESGILDEINKKEQ